VIQPSWWRLVWEWLVERWPLVWRKTYNEDLELFVGLGEDMVTHLNEENDLMWDKLVDLGQTEWLCELRARNNPPDDEAGREG
jgi:hypothetical protein